jgi:hypothetical protein
MLMKATTLHLILAVAGPAVIDLARAADTAASSPAAPVSDQVKKDSKDSITVLGLTVPKAEFHDDHVTGVDPFFPRSTRRTPKPREIVTVPTRTAPDTRRIDYLTLKGITGTSDRRLALINNMAFAAGEVGNVRVPGGSLKIRVVNVGEKSVTVAVEGDSVLHELKIRDYLHDFTKVP